MATSQRSAGGSHRKFGHLLVGHNALGGLLEFDLMTIHMSSRSTDRGEVARTRNSEQTVNFVLGRIIRAKNVRWKEATEPEKTEAILDSQGKRPDIVVSHPGGLPVVIETEIAPARTVEADAKKRLGNSFTKDSRRIEQAIALCIPEDIATEYKSRITESLASAKFKYCLFFERFGEGGKQLRWPEAGWIEGGIDDFVGFVERTALTESSIAQGMETLQLGIGKATDIVRRDNKVNLSAHKKISNLLNQKDNALTTRMAMAIIANAILFHSALENIHDVKPLSLAKDTNGKYRCDRLLHIWQYILDQINYRPIFKIASDILGCLRKELADRVIRHLVKVALKLSEIGTASQHDLSGRLFQRLITDRKFLAIFYTMPSSAALLAELAVTRMNTDWSDEHQVTDLRVADFACGTGSLLNAAYNSLLTRYRRTGKDDSKIHAEMIEKVIVGTDIMPAATHLTASIISSSHPAIPFKNTQIITLPYGRKSDVTGEPIEIGSLDLINEEGVFPLFNTGQERLAGTSTGDKDPVNLLHRSFDLVIMNPPFTRPTGHEAKSIGIPVPAFAGFSTSKDEQRLMSKKLSAFRRPGMAGRGNAGLASNFIDIAEAKVKVGGVVAFVLPATFASGKAWSASRELFERYYQDITVICIANTGTEDRAFSADTGLGEVLVIATRMEGENTEVPPVTYINLSNRPESILEAFEFARLISDIESDSVKGALRVGDNPSFAQYIRSKSGFKGYTGIWDVDLAETANDLDSGLLKTPREVKKFRLPLTKLDELGERSVYCLDINGTEKLGSGLQRGPFDIEKLDSKGLPTYPILWAHQASRETKLVVKPDRQGQVRERQEERAAIMWKTFAGRLCFNCDFAMTSQPLSACMASVDVIPGRAWPGFRCDNAEHDIPIVLWANSTIGLISYWWRATRQQVGRASLTITNLPSLIVIDPRKLSEQQIALANKIFEDISSQDLLPANEAYRDPVRQKLDEALFVDLLGFDRKIMPSLSLLRDKWCNEPSVHGGKSTRPTNQSNLL